MKSFLISSMLLLSCGLLCAEEMQFITLLAQPVGSFAKVELLNNSKPAEIFHINFCNTDAASGQINVSGTSRNYPIDTQNLRVLSPATLTGNVKTFLVSSGEKTISVGQSANFVGGTLAVSNTAPARILVDDGSDASGAAEFIYQNTALTSKAGNFRTMDIANTAVLNTVASGEALSSNLSWKELSNSDGDVAFVLTDADVSSDDEEEEECTLTCGSLATLDEATCTCKFNTTIGGGIVGGGGFIKACNGKTCPTGQTLDTTTCRCKGGISNPCPGVSCTNGSINILTCKCIGYIERN